MTVSCESLKAEELRLRYRELLRDPSVFPTGANWDYIIANRMEGLGDLLYVKYRTALGIDDADRDELHSVALDNFPLYLRAVSPAYAADVVYSHVADGPVAFDLIRRCRLFSAGHIAGLVERGDLSVLDVVDAYREEYDEAEYGAMRRLDSLIHRLPQLGRIESVRGLLGAGTRYICPAGHSNDSSARFCTRAGCGLDARGLTKAQSDAIDRFRHRLTALANLLAKN